MNNSKSTVSAFVLLLFTAICPILPSIALMAIVPLVFVAAFDLCRWILRKVGTVKELRESARIIGRLTIVIVFLPLFTYWVMRLSVALGTAFYALVEHKMDDAQFCIELITALIGLGFSFTLFNLRRLLFRYSLCSSSIAVAMLMFCSGYLSESSFNSESSFSADPNRGLERKMNILKNCIGHPGSEIENQLGMPRAKEGPLRLKGWPAVAATSDENWLYDFNGTNVLVTFKNGKCRSIQKYDFMLDFEYQEWRTKSIRAFSTGKKKDVIKKAFGSPTQIRHDCEWAGLEDSDEDWSYDTGSNSGAILGFRGDICTGTSANERYGGLRSKFEDLPTLADVFGWSAH